MIVRLHNLASRQPTMADLKEVTALIVACDIAEYGTADHTKEDVQKSWQAPGFNLNTDAWIIVSHKGHIVGYADIHRGEGGQLTFVVYVHPDYRGRGIGTLLVWLVEERARQMAWTMPADVRVTLSIHMSSLNQRAIQLLEREGYSRVRHYLRLFIEVDEEAMQPDEDCQCRKVRMDLVIDAQKVMEATPLARRTGIYVARQYEVYEKELRAGTAQSVEGEHDRQFASA